VARAPAPGSDRCPRCDATFGCGIGTGSCWCRDVHLTVELRDRLAEQYDGCLCPACLQELAAPVAPAAPPLA
jgi:hypothetical protein